MMNFTTRLDNWFPKGRTDATISALGYYVPMVRYYYPQLKTWSVVQSVVLLQNATYGGQVHQHPDLYKDSFDVLTNSSWLSDINDTRVAPIKKSLAVAGGYQLAFTGGDWLPLLNAAANAPLEPVSVANPVLYSEEYGNRMSIYANWTESMGIMLQQRTLRFMYANDSEGQIITFYFGREWTNPKQFPSAFVNATGILMGVPLSPLVLRAEAVDPRLLSQLILTGSAVEFLQKTPFLWVDAVPIVGQSDIFLVNITTVDGKQKKIWSKMYDAGWLTAGELDNLTSPNTTMAGRTTLLVDRAMRGIMKSIQGQYGTDTRYLKIFYATQYLFPMSSSILSHAVQLQTIQRSFRYQPDKKQALSPLSDLVRH